VVRATRVYAAAVTQNFARKKSRKLLGNMRWIALAAMALLALAALAYAESWLDAWLRDQPLVVNSMLAALSLFGAPDALQARYELFHTAYVSGGCVTIADQPLVPGQNVTELLQIAKAIRDAYDRGLLKYAANETGHYAYYNGTLALAIERASGDEWSVKFGEWTSRQLDGSTWLNYTNLWMNVNGTVLEYLALLYVRYINETHRLYVITLAQVGRGGYQLAFTYANYWFKNKTVYFGDWVVVANTTLSGYYAALSRAVDALAKKWQASDKQYKPQAYPQISQALGEISRAVAGTDIDKPLGRGYALVTDVPAPLIAGVAAATFIGGWVAWATYSKTGSVGRAAACGLWYATNVLIGAMTPPLLSWTASILWRGYLTFRIMTISYLMRCQVLP